MTRIARWPGGRIGECDRGDHLVVVDVQHDQIVARGEQPKLRGTAEAVGVARDPGKASVAAGHSPHDRVWDGIVPVEEQNGWDTLTIVLDPPLEHTPMAA